MPDCQLFGNVQAAGTKVKNCFLHETGNCEFYYQLCRYQELCKFVNAMAKDGKSFKST